MVLQAVLAHGVARLHRRVHEPRTARAIEVALHAGAGRGLGRAREVVPVVAVVVGLADLVRRGMRIGMRAGTCAGIHPARAAWARPMAATHPSRSAPGNTSPGRLASTNTRASKQPAQPAWEPAGLA